MWKEEFLGSLGISAVRVLSCDWKVAGLNPGLEGPGGSVVIDLLRQSAVGMV